ncbi:hypothetical protein TI39_contig4202g00048 [Zymoseptoria brevis]|uniref:Uncharacterized protein n=1 Tax=Zymoseptoria brevis TaxID=1047168 RepID=A0A0F4GDP6_9PEZI|nr:hypothetical protein TI39_contig4202g00048 [Zymoseptoria brevis]
MEPTTPANASFINCNRYVRISFHATDVHVIFDTLVDHAGDMLDPLPTADHNFDTTDAVLQLRNYPNFSDRDLRLDNDTKFEARIDILSLPAVLAPVKEAITEFRSNLVTAKTLYALRHEVDDYLILQKVHLRYIDTYLDRMM